MDRSLRARDLARFVGKHGTGRRRGRSSAGRHTDPDHRAHTGKHRGDTAHTRADLDAGAQPDTDAQTPDNRETRKAATPKADQAQTSPDPYANADRDGDSRA
jgi:hypothetical protein